MVVAKPMTVSEFEEYALRPENVNRRLELIYGGVIEKPMPTQLHGYIAAQIAGALRDYIKTHPLGWEMVEARYAMPNDTENDRIPDVSFVSVDKGELVEEGPAPYMPDLAVEVKSPGDKLHEMRSKADYYLANGTRIVWLVYTEKRIVTVLTPDSEDILQFDDVLTGGDLLPGFELPVKDLFPKKPVKG
jgi:Uma2 family endonuclease